MAHVAVVTDSVACLSPERRAELGIGMVGIRISLDGEEFRDSVDLTSEEFYARLGTFQTHTTAAPSVGDWVEEFERLVDAGAEQLLVVTVAANLSATYNSARTAAELMSVPTVVVDSRTASAAEGMFVRRLAEEARAGASLEELAARAEQRRGGYSSEFVLAGLDRLAKSGRMPAAMARLGDAMHLKPMLLIKESGELRPSGAARGLDRGIDRLHRRALEALPPGTPARAAVTHALLEEEANALARRLTEDRPELDLEVVVFSPVMGSHTGPIVGMEWEDPAIAAEAG